MEKIFISIFSIINPILIGNLSKYKGMDGKDIAKAINKASNNQEEKVKIYRWNQMANLLGNI